MTTARRAAVDSAMTPLFNNAAQAWNHAFYWNSLRPKNAPGPQDALAARIRLDFGDERRFAEALKSAATGHFGSGWGWLVTDADGIVARDHLQTARALRLWLTQRRGRRSP